jgi:alkyldihydroxyacetonephosphate synthase
MRRWNGWGDPAVSYPLKESALAYLESRLGRLSALPDAGIEDALKTVPASRLGHHPLVSREPAERLLHARGQSLPDWVALRSGQPGPCPDGVAYPESEEDVRRLLAWAAQVGACLIPYGGGTSVVGHINPLPGEQPVLTVDMSRMARLVSLERDSHLATFEAGVSGPELERQLAASGFTLGHFPQSFELSTLGGWIASRSSGQQSYHYGRIEDLFAGGRLETPAGPLDLPPLPASAAGPDLRHLALGSEGRLGIITRAVVRIRPRSETEAFYGVFFHTWEAGAAAVRAIAQAGVRVSMLRLSNPQETETTLVLSGKDRLVDWANRGLNLLGYRATRALLILGVTGSPAAAAFARRQAEAICREHGGLLTGERIGHTWQKNRFLTPYLRNTLWERGAAVDTLETALPWERALPAAGQIQAAIQQAAARFDEKVLVFAHLSHVYRDGASIYVTFVFRRGPHPERLLRLWGAMKAAASLEILAHHGTISHQHGVGLDHAPYLSAEKGALGMAALRAALHSFDPGGLLNPGKLLPEDAPQPVSHVDDRLA